MAIEVGDKIYRNLPEQVEWLSNQFVRILEAFEELGTVMRYKGSVATYADLPTENNKVGDVYNVLDTGSNYAWDGESWDEIGSTVDLSNLVTLDTEQDITANKNLISVGIKFSNANKVGYTIKNRGDGYLSIYNNNNNVVYDFDNNGFINRENKDLGSSTYKWKNIFLENSSASKSWKIEPTTWGSLRINDGSGNTYFAIYDSSGQRRVGAGVDNQVDLGSSNERWKDLYLSGRIYLTDSAYIYGTTYYIYSKGHFYPDYTGTYDLGSSSYSWRDLYLSGTQYLDDAKIQFGNSNAGGNAKWVLEEDGYGRFVISRIYNNNKVAFWTFNGGNLIPATNNFNDVGSGTSKIRDVYIAGNISDGTNSITVADIAKKPTTVTVEIDNQTGSVDLSSYAGKFVVLAAGEQAMGTWRPVFTLPSTIVGVSFNDVGSSGISLIGLDMQNHLVELDDVDNLDQGSFCVIDLSDGLTAKIIANKNMTIVP